MIERLVASPLLLRASPPGVTVAAWACAPPVASTSAVRQQKVIASTRMGMANVARTLIIIVIAVFMDS